MTRSQMNYAIVACAMCCCYWVGMGAGIALAMGRTPQTVLCAAIATAFLVWVPHIVIDFVLHRGGAPTQEGE